MIEFITDAGVSLDLSPDAEFQIDFESPIFADDRMPVAFSTQVSFPPTPRNLAAFGILPGTLNLPSKSAIRVVMHAGGIPLFPGLLVFDGIEDGQIQYSFSGTDVAESFGELDIADFAPLASVSVNEISGIQHGDYLFVKAPLLINKELVASPIYDSEDGLMEGCGLSKYSNLYPGEHTLFTPAFPFYQFVYGIFSKNGMTVTIDEQLVEILSATHILGQYRPKVSDGNRGILADTSSAVALGKMLPDMAVSDFLSNIMKMFCCALFRDGRGYRLQAMESVLDSIEIIDLDSIVDDSLDMFVESAQSYRFAYAEDNGNSYSSNQLDEDIASGNVTKCETLEVIFDTEAEEYTPYYHEPSGCVYSSRKMACGVTSEREGTVSYMACPQRLTDLLFCPHEAVRYEGDSSPDAEADASVEFHLVRCIPENVNTSSRNIYTNGPRIAPVMEFEKAGNERGNEAYVGIIENSQMSDSGIVTSHPDAETDFDSGLSLRPQALFDMWHISFAKWLGKDRVCAKASLSLSLIELASLRLYSKVYFRGRLWLIRKLSVAFSAKTDSVKTEGEFVSL